MNEPAILHSLPVVNAASMFTAKEPTASRRVLHNFSFPNQVSWDSKRVLRCKSPVTARSRKKPPSMEAPPPWNLRNRRPEEQIPNPNPNPSLLLPPFSVSLSFDEIEEDFVRMKGRKPYRRPKKRARIVQKKLDSLFPGLWLQEIMSYSNKIDD